MKDKLEGILSNKRLRNILTLLIVAVIVIASIGVGTTLAANDNPTEATLAISEKAAKEIAFNKVGGGTLNSFEIDKENGVKVYKVEIIKGDYEYDIEINAMTGEVIGYSQEKIKVSKSTTTPKAIDSNNSTNSAGSSTNSSDESKNTNSDSSKNSDGYIGKEKAKSIATNKVGGGKVIYCHLDYDDGRAEYEIKIIKGDYEYEMEIDAKTGKIRDYEKERIDDDDDDDDDDDYDDEYDD